MEILEWLIVVFVLFIAELFLLVLAFRWLNTTIRAWITWFMTKGKDMTQAMVPKIGLKDAIGFGLFQFFQSDAFHKGLEGFFSKGKT